MASFSKKFTRDLAKGLTQGQVFDKLKAAEVLFKNNHLIIVNKRALVASQPDEHSTGKDMGAMVKSFLKEKERKSGAVFLGTLHRLDRSASGCMCFAKTSKSATRIVTKPVCRVPNTSPGPRNSRSRLAIRKPSLVSRKIDSRDLANRPSGDLYINTQLLSAWPRPTRPRS